MAPDKKEFLFFLWLLETFALTFAETLFLPAPNATQWAIVQSADT